MRDLLFSSTNMAEMTERENHPLKTLNLPIYVVSETSYKNACNRCSKLTGRTCSHLSWRFVMLPLVAAVSAIVVGKENLSKGKSWYSFKMQKYNFMMVQRETFVKNDWLIKRTQEPNEILAVRILLCNAPYVFPNTL